MEEHLLGQPDEAIVCGTLAQLRDYDLGGPLHCLTLCAPELHELEAAYLEQFRLPAPVVPPAPARLREEKRSPTSKI